MELIISTKRTIILLALALCLPGISYAGRIEQCPFEVGIKHLGNSTLIDCSELLLEIQVRGSNEDPLLGVTIEIALEEEFEVVDNMGFSANGTNSFGENLWILTTDLPSYLDTEVSFFYMRVKVNDLVGGVGLARFSATVSASGCASVDSDSFFDPDYPETTIASGTSVDVSTLTFTPQIGGIQLQVNGTLVIDQNQSLPTGIDIGLGPNAKILVESGNTLKAEDATFFGCSELWETIELESGSSLVLSESIIEDALRGITANGGSVVSLRYNDFINNRVGLYFPTSSTGPEAELSSFFGNNFTAPELKSSQYSMGYAGVEAHDMSAVDLSGAQAPGVAAWNTYSELENGIVLINSSASVENSRFLNMPDGLGIFTNSASPYDLLFQRGFGKNGTTTFENCDIGIKGQKSVVFAQENNMENNRIGFNVEQSNRIVIRNNSLSGDQRQFMTGVSLSQNTPALVLVGNNDFSFSPQQFTSFIFPPEARGIIANENPFGVVLGAYRLENNLFSSISAELSKGITLQNGRFISIRNNSILSDGSNFSSSTGYGMKVNTSRGFIGCNEIAELEVGTVNDTEFGIEINSDASSTFICNDMDQTDTGLKIMFSDANTDLIANTFNEHQVGLLVSDAIGDQVHNGNLWLEPAPSGGWQAFHESSDPAVIIDSEFITDGFENSFFLPTQVNTGQWFSTVADPAATITCPTSGQCPDGIGAITEKMLEIDSTDQFVANGTIDFDLYPSEQLWRAQRHLYARIKDFNVPLTYGTPEYSFVQTAETSNIGAFYLAEKKIEETLRPDAVLDSVIQDLNTERQETMSSLSQTNQLLLEASNSTDSLNAVQLKVNQLDTIRTLKTTVDSLGLIIEEKRVLSLASAHSLLNSISTSNSMESDWKFMLNLFVSRLIEGNEMSKEESTLLLRIANMCIAKGGDATSLARSMYAAINPDIQFDDALLCSPPPALAAPTPTGNALVYPNPTSGEEVNLKTGWTEANTAEAILFNGLGQPVWQRTLELFGGNANFQLGNLPEGWYQLSLRAEGEQNVIPLMIQR